MGVIKDKKTDLVKETELQTIVIGAIYGSYLWLKF